MLQMSKVKIRGTPDAQLPNTIQSTTRAGMVVESKGAVWTSGVRAIVQQDVFKDVADDDVLAIEIAGGLQLWTRFDDFKQDFPGSSTRARHWRC